MEQSPSHVAGSLPGSPGALDELIRPGWGNITGADFHESAVPGPKPSKDLTFKP